MYCPYCGKQTADTASFCGSCGRKIKHGSPSADKGVVPGGGGTDDAAKPNREKDRDRTVTDKPQKPGTVPTGKIALPVCCAIAAAVVIAAVSFLLLNGDGTASGSTQTAEAGTDGTASGAAQAEEIRPDIQSALDAAGRMSRRFAALEDGSAYFDQDLIKYAYAYFNKPVEAVYASGSDDFVLAVMEDGSLYDGTNLLLEGVGIRDVCWGVYKKRAFAYILADDGSIYKYSPEEEEEDKRLDLVFPADPDDTSDMITAICSTGDYLFSIRKNGNIDSVISLGNISSSGWKDVVQAACAASKEGSSTAVTALAAITKDGTVLAQGDYAEDILAMGDLKYITMTNTASLIIGLKTDGTLAVAGSEAAEYSYLEDFEDIAGIRLTAWSPEVLLYTIDEDGRLHGSDCEYYLDPEGDFYRSGEELEAADEWMNAAEYAAYREAQEASAKEKSEVASGTCGDSAEWVLYDDGELRISGFLEMKYYNSASLAPWQVYSSRITSVVVEPGITGIGSRAFEDCEGIQSVEIADSVASIGTQAFGGCSSLREIVLPARLTEIIDGAFINCDSLTSVSIPAGVMSVRDYAFCNCDSLSDVYYAGTEEDWARVKIGKTSNECLDSAEIHYNAQ